MTESDTHRTIDAVWRIQAQQEQVIPDLDAVPDDAIGDDLLQLLFLACHPVLAP